MQLKLTDEEDENLEDIQERIKSFWINYCDGDMKVIRKAILDLSERKPN